MTGKWERGGFIKLNGELHQFAVKPAPTKDALKEDTQKECAIAGSPGGFNSHLGYPTNTINLSHLGWEQGGFI
ncbi:hypothetical protein [Coleofasciculus sp. F4-SAH-05]|uniref:hypothetical protein n=1 Tax=Coleofasciculus sp. F4-SAH-05 TaxID=3069525 RepID=UPI0032FE3F89